jgi:hypothetical protein
MLDGSETGEIDALCITENGENLFLVVKTRELNSGTTMKESAITKELAILEILPRFKSHQIKKLWSQLEQREQFSCGTCLKKSSLVNKIKTKLEQR